MGRRSLISLHQTTFQLILLLDFSNLTSHLENTGIGISGCPVSLDNKKTELGSSSHNEVSPSSGEDIGIVLVPCRTWKCIPPAISGELVILEVP